MLYAFGGYDSGYAVPAPLSNFSRFNPRNNSWTDLVPISNGSVPSARYAMGFTSTPDGRLFVFGGHGESGLLGDLSCYDPAVGVWTALGGGGEPPSARESMGFVATSDGRLWVYGGYHESALGDLRSYDPDSGNWTLARDRGLLDIQIARYGMGMTAGPGAFLYVFGGSDGSDVLGDLIRYNLTRNVWESVVTTSRPIPRSLLGMASIGGILYVFGGASASELGELPTILYYLDPVLSSVWRQYPASASGPSSRNGMGFASTPNGQLYVAYGAPKIGSTVNGGCANRSSFSLYQQVMLAILFKRDSI
uniref:Uncharacterized protein n=1 Tax=Cryptomonas curvata TaxID=233186 RepID=A0A6T8DVU2_9CRYP